jgi:serine protease Do
LIVTPVPTTARRAALPAPVRALLLGAALLVSACALPTNDASARAAPDSFSPLVKRVLPAVVNIAVTETIAGNDIANALPPALRGTPFEREFRNRYGKRREQLEGAGSGFIIDASGVIVTNNHVVGHADKIVVSLNDGTELPATVVGTDELTDIAVIKVTPPGPLAYVSWGDSDKVEVGDWILAAGNPFGLGGSVTAGIVSARGRDIGSGPFDDFLQLDAPINPGNSGGPTFNMDAQVVGVNTAIVSPTGGSVGIGFAVPSNMVSHIVADLRDKGRIDRGWLGVSVEETPAASGRSTGVVVAAVERGGPASRAGLRVGDALLAVNGDSVNSSRALIRAVAAAEPGSNVKITVRRSGQQMDISVTVGRRPNGTDG